MRSWWPVAAIKLDNKRLLGEHNELLIMARSICGLSKGWKNHPETKRWVGHSKAMKARHDEIAEEMVRRGMNHKSPWPDELVDDSHTDDFPA
ncbi:MAG: pyrimidine dimer DNA glycosylase, partial [bacterium]|nr:pyrimidine dimer DNA glycosylase [Candidatus Kapabacteria bacterium]